MLVHYYTQVNAPIGGMVSALEDIRVNLRAWGEWAYREGESLYARVGPDKGGIAKEVVLDIEPSVTRGDSVFYPVSWWATGARMLFPRMQADLILTPIGEGVTRLSFLGSYEPPLGALGHILDRAVLGRVADATVKAWVDRIASEMVPSLG